MKTILIAILALFSFQSYAQERKVILEKPHVDPRVELISIAFRLAGNPEYSNQFKPYSDRIEQHFDKYKNHELIQFIRSIAKQRGIGYDSPVWLSIHVDENLDLIKDVKRNFWEKDSRWTKEIAEQFIPLLKQFAIETQFDDFFESNADLYTQSVSLFAPLYESLDMDWYLSFYGQEPLETFSIILGLNNESNYGPSVDYSDGSRKVYSIMGVQHTDDLGMPKFDYNLLAAMVIVHEFNHSFVNILVDRNIDALKESGQKLFSLSKDVLSQQGYSTWEIGVYETIVRAAVIKYMKDHDYDPRAIDAVKQFDKACGFIWIDDIVEALEQYDRQRDIYPTLESYMPKIIEAYNTWAGKINN